MSYRCATCGQVHDDLPDLGYALPLYVQDIPEDEREQRVQLSEDLCSVDDEYFFIRGVIEIPIHDYPERFGFGVLVSQKEENFRRYVEHFDSAEIGPFFGWLSNEIAFYNESTLELKTMAHFQGQGLRPFIEVEPSDHPLSRDQQGGISLDKAWKIVHVAQRPELETP